MLHMIQFEGSCPRCGHGRMGKVAGCLCPDTFAYIGELICQDCWWTCGYDIEQAQDDIAVHGVIHGSDIINKRLRALWKEEMLSRRRI